MALPFFDLQQVGETIDVMRNALGTVSDARTAVQSLGAIFGSDPKDPPDPELAQAANDALRKLIDTQLLQSDILDRLHRMETAMRQANRMEQERARYRLVSTPTGHIVLQLNPDDPAGEPPHHVCASCFEDGHKSILQPFRKPVVRCHRCKQQFALALLEPQPYRHPRREWL